MSLEEFLEYNWQDGCIKKLMFEKDILNLTMKDWKDRIVLIKFENIFKLCVNEYLEEDISHLSYSQGNDQDVSVVLHSAWDEKEILRFTIETE